MTMATVGPQVILLFSPLLPSCEILNCYWALLSEMLHTKLVATQKDKTHCFTVYVDVIFVDLESLF